MVGEQAYQPPGSTASTSGESEASGVRRADRDLMALAIGMAAIIMFVGTGSNIMPQVIQSLQGYGLPPDRLLSNALILNIALIIFGLRRYRDLSDEVRERRRAEARARDLAERDPLTGCLNRRSIAMATDALIARTLGAGSHVGFIMIDIDNFKRINDANGHSAGDTVLQTCTQRIGALLPPHGLLARVGGDELACVIPFPASGHDVIEAFAARLIREVARPIIIARTSLDVTVSVGLACTDSSRLVDRPVDAQSLQHMADIAMYHAKKAGKNRHSWFEPQMERELRERSELEQAIRTGLQNGEFVPHYQQQIDLPTGRIIGFEMLARWNSECYGHLGPEEFIPVAEDLDVIGALSEHLIRQALRDAQDWGDAIRLSVNISPVQLRDPWFAQRLLKLLLEYHFPPSRLEIEVTESCLHENLTQVRSTLVSLKNQGISIALDDFGSGYSSLAQLHSLPFDRIKIDRSFVTPMPGNSESATIVHAIAALGKGLGLPVTAEGVENAEIAEHLRQLGALNAQGFLYGHAEPAEQTRQRLTEQRLTDQGQSEQGATELGLPPGQRAVR